MYAQNVIGIKTKLNFPNYFKTLNKITPAGNYLHKIQNMKITKT